MTGLEISASQVIAATAHVQAGRVVADRLAARSLRPGLVRDGLVLNVDALAGELRALFAEHNLPKRVRVGLATPRTVLRVVDLPPIDESDVAAALPVLAQDAIPMPLDRAVLDHQTIGLIDTPEGRRLQTVVVATERQGVETIAETLERAGLRPEGIDLSVFGAIRAIAGAEIPAGPVMYVQLGDIVNLAIAENGVCRFTRQGPQGLSMILDRLAGQRDITFDAAQDLLAAATGDRTADIDPLDVREVGELLSRVAGDLASELRASAEFYGSQFGAAVGTGVLTGPLTTLRGFVDAVGDASGLALRPGHAELADPLLAAEVDPRVAPVAVGLSVGRVTP